MQQVIGHCAQRRGGGVPPEGIDLRGVFRFPLERYAHKIPPSVAAETTMVGAP